MREWITRPFRQRKLNFRLADAIGCGAVEEARSLLHQGADPNTHGGGECILSCAGRSPESNAACVRLLLEWGADVEGSPRGRCVSPLLRASHLSDDARIRILVEHGAELNVVHPRTPGFTPMQELSKWAALDTLNLLLDHGADPNMPSLIRRWRALHVAAVSGRPEVVELLLARGADPLAPDAGGKTALDWASCVLAERMSGGDVDDKLTLGIKKTIEVLKRMI